MFLIIAVVLFCLLPFAVLYWLARKYPEAEAELLVPQDNDIDALIEKLSNQPVNYLPSAKYGASPPSRPVPDNVVNLRAKTRPNRPKI
jgi:hypothetical protein